MVYQVLESYSRFAVIYAAVREFVNYRLKQKKLSLEQLSFQAQKDAKQKEEEFEEIIRDDESE